MENNALPTQLGRYEIVRELGQGAMGTVYEGRDPALERRVAIKTARRDMLARAGLSQEMMERFLREARAAGRLNHPNIITIYDVGEEQGVAYIAMEFLEGKDLGAAIAERRVFDVRTVVDYGVRICGALACAHDQGIVHRDIKPANIVITDQGSIKVVDFGIAHTADSTLTKDGAMIGTPNYMSPEQFMGQAVDARSDLFSLGIITYEMLTGERPFSGEALTTVMHHVMKSEPASPHELNFHVPEALSIAVMRALAKKPQERYPDARTMARALEEGMKPHPDMGVILGTNMETEATLLDASSQTAQKAPQPTTGSTASTVLEVADETLPEQPPPDAFKTITEDDGTVVPKGPAAAPGMRGILLSAAIVVLCLVAAGVLLIFAIGRDGEVALQRNDEPPGATASEDVPDTLVDVGVWVYVAEDWQVAEEFGERLREGANIPAWISSLPDGSVALAEQKGVTVRVSHPQTGEVYSEQSLPEGYGMMPMPQNVPRVRYDLLRNGAPIYNVEVRVDEALGPEAQYFVLSAAALQNQE